MSLPEAKDVYILWATDYYDGDLSGIARWNGDLHYFHFDDVLDGLAGTQQRVYNLYRMTPEHVVEHTRLQEDVLDYQGSRYDYRFPVEMPPRIRQDVQLLHEKWSKPDQSARPGEMFHERNCLWNDGAVAQFMFMDGVVHFGEPGNSR